MELLVRNKVKDYERWRRVFDAELEGPRSAGLNLVKVWQSVDDPNEVFFVFRIDDRAKAEEFMHAPESAAAGVEAGVIQGEAWFVEPRS